MNRILFALTGTACLLLNGCGKKSAALPDSRSATSCSLALTVATDPPTSEYLEHGDIRITGVFTSDCGYDPATPITLTVRSLDSGLSKSYSLPKHAKVDTQFDPVTGAFTWACDGEFRLGEGHLILEVTGKAANGDQIAWLRAVESGSEFDDYSRTERMDARQDFGYRSMTLFDTYADFIAEAREFGIDETAFPQVALDNELLELARESWITPLIADPDCSNWRTGGEQRVQELEALLAQYPLQSPADRTYRENLITGAHMKWASMGWEQDSETSWLILRYGPDVVPRRTSVPALFRAGVDALEHTFPAAEIVRDADSLTLHLRYFADEGTPEAFSGTADANADIFPTPVPDTAFTRPPVTEISVILEDSDSDGDLDTGRIEGYRSPTEPVVITELQGHLITGLAELNNSPYFSPG